MIPFILFALMLLSLGNLMYFNAAGIIILIHVFKFLTSLFFVLIAVSSRKKQHNKKYFSFMLSGLIFSLVGDVFLSFFDNSTFFILGLFSFSVAHIFYSIGFCVLTKMTWKDIAFASVLAIPVISFVKLKDGFDFGSMFPLIVMYAILISVMLSKSLSLLKLREGNILPITLIISGTLLFFISDFILVFVLYYSNKAEILTYLNLMTYYLGQGLLALSFIKVLKVKALEKS